MPVRVSERSSYSLGVGRVSKKRVKLFQPHTVKLLVYLITRSLLVVMGKRKLSEVCWVAVTVYRTEEEPNL